MVKNKKRAKEIFIYFRYIFGALLALLMLLGMLIPCLEYTVDTQKSEPVSALTLMSNSWETSRAYLFDGGTQKVDEQTSFSKALFATVILLSALFVLGFLAAFYTAACAFSYFKNPKKTDNNRIFFLTLMPNQAVVCAFCALTLPLTFLPRIILSFYTNILEYPTTLKFSVFEPWIIALVIYALFVVAVIISARFERELSMNPLYNEVKEKRRAEKKRVIVRAEESEEYEEDIPEEELSAEEAYRAAQAERIRQMFTIKENTDENKEDK